MHYYFLSVYFLCSCKCPRLGIQRERAKTEMRNSFHCQWPEDNIATWKHNNKKQKQKKWYEEWWLSFNYTGQCADNSLMHWSIGVCINKESEHFFIYIYNNVFHFRYCWHLIPLDCFDPSKNNGYFIIIFEVLYKANCYLWHFAFDTSYQGVISRLSPPLKYQRVVNSSYQRS